MHSVNTLLVHVRYCERHALSTLLLIISVCFSFYIRNLKSRKSFGTNILKFVHECDKISQSTSILITHDFHQKGKINVMEETIF